jgi:UDP-GlcNAc:undecaprenyl-phosphate GlcNAc-1-phosphate transferase
VTPTVTIVAIFVVALACTLAGTPAARALATRLAFVDRPTARKTHGAPVPLLGGLAIYAAVVLAIAALGRHHLPELATILVGASLMALTGLVDDRAPLPSAAKAGLELAIVIGVMVAGVDVMLGWLPAWANLMLTVLWIVGITNAVNLMDNMDGLCAGVSAIAAGFFTLAAWMNGQYLVGMLGAALVGACVGFLVFNTRPASVFMGDTGSLFLGFLLAVLGIKLRFPERPSTVTWMVPVLIMAVPIFDTSMVVWSRLRRGVNPFTTAGTDHLSHRLVAAGWTPLTAVVTVYVASVMTGSLALAVMHASVGQAYAVAAAAAAAAGVLAWRLAGPRRP